MKSNVQIHKSACIHPKAELEQRVIVGPYSVIGEHVKVASGTIIGNSCVIEGRTQIGKNCKIFTGAVIGSNPQDLKYKGEDTEVIIGDNNIIREYVTINLGTVEKGQTLIGDNNLFMAYAHVAHDCLVESEVIVANVGTLAGHVEIGERAVIGGMVALHQFTRVGKLAIIGGCSKVIQDVPPYSMTDGHPTKIYGINTIGLKRAKIPEQSIHYLKVAFKILFKMKLSTSNAIKRINNEIPKDSHVEYLIKFIKSSKRGVCKGS